MRKFKVTDLGNINTSKISKIKAEESFIISEQGYTVGKMLDGTECQVLLDTGASKSFMSKSHCTVGHSILCPNLHRKHKGLKWEMDNFSAFYL